MDICILESMQFESQKVFSSKNTAKYIYLQYITNFGFIHFFVTLSEKTNFFPIICILFRELIIRY